MSAYGAGAHFPSLRCLAQAPPSQRRFPLHCELLEERTTPSSDPLLGTVLGQGMCDALTPVARESWFCSQQGTEILFVDSSVPGLERMLSGLPTEVHRLDSQAEGVAQIAEVLSGRQGITTIHLFTHGAAGQVMLGQTVLTRENIDNYALEWNTIRAALAPGADLLLYGCDVAAGEGGEAFVNRLATVTGADVAASINATGSNRLGGDWLLEYTTGSIEATLPAVPLLAEYEGILAQVVGWGDNSFGQCTAPAGLTNVVAIAAGEFHSLALRSDGTVVAWGSNYAPGSWGSWVYAGQSVVPADLTNVVAIAAGDYHSLALKADGTVVAWGWNGSSQSTVPAGLSGVVAIAAGGYHSLALKADGSIVVWGADNLPPPGLTNVVQIAAGTQYSLALRANGRVVSWGSGAPAPPPSLNHVVDIAAGDYHGLALKSDGTVVAWGANGDGQCNVPAGLTNVVDLAAGNGHSLALKSDGTVVGWGWNHYGQCTPPAGLPPVKALAAGMGFTLVLVNAAPVLDPATHPIFAMLENPGDPPAVTVAEAIPDGAITDPDGPAVEALAVVGVDNSHGQWQYSLDSGATWLPFSLNTGMVDLTTTARLLGPDSLVRFVPNTDWSGDANLTFRAWDQDTGTLGGTADTTVHGGSTAFSDATALATAHVLDTEARTVQIVLPGEEVYEGQDVILASTVMGTWGAVSYEWAVYEVTTNNQVASGTEAQLYVFTSDGGRFRIELSAYDSLGLVGKDVVETTVVSVPPSAEIEGPDTGDEGQSAIFSAINAYEPGHSDLDFQWTVTGPGYDYTTGGNPLVFEPPDEGEYTITLMVTDVSEGDSSISTRQFTVNDVPPFLYTDILGSASEGDSLTFSAWTQDVCADYPMTYLWEVTKDGTTLLTHVETLDETTPSTLDFTPADAGVYQVTVLARDIHGVESEPQVNEVYVEGRLPEVWQEPPWPQEGREGEELTFAVNAVDPGGSPLMYIWEITDPDNSTQILSGSDPSLTFTPPDKGEYLLRLTVHDTGDEDQYEMVQSVWVEENPTRVSIVGPKEGDEGKELVFHAEAVEPGGSPLGYRWLVLGPSFFKVGYGADFAFTPPDDGSYNLCLRVRDRGDGDTGWDHVEIGVQNVAPVVVDLNISTPGPIGAPITLEAVASDVPADTITYHWEVYHEGSLYERRTGTDASSFTFTPAEGGLYSISLVVSDEDGGISTPPLWSSVFIPEEVVPIPGETTIPIVAPTTTTDPMEIAAAIALTSLPTTAVGAPVPGGITGGLFATGVPGPGVTGTETGLPAHALGVVTGSETLDLAGVVFVDHNGNGMQEGDEPGVPGVTVLVQGPVERTAVTDENGVYRFLGLVPGEYVLTRLESAPGKSAVTPIQMTEPGRVIPAGSETQRPTTLGHRATRNVHLVPGEKVEAVNFAVMPIEPVTPGPIEGKPPVRSTEPDHDTSEQGARVHPWTTNEAADAYFMETHEVGKLTLDQAAWSWLAIGTLAGLWERNRNHLERGSAA